MNDATRPQSSRSRDRAVERIGSITVGTAIVGLAATGAFGALAAITYAGQPAATNPTTTVNSDITGGNSGTTTSPQDPGTYGGGSGTTSNNGTANGAPFQPVQVPSTTSSRHAHASSGGSGG